MEPTKRKKGEPKRRATRSIYWIQQEPWPEPLKLEKPSKHGLRPKEKKKIQGTYKNHKKKRGIMMVMYPRKDQWIGRTAERRVITGSPVECCSQFGLPTSELIKMDENSESLDPVICEEVSKNRMRDDYKEKRKLPTHEHRSAERTNWVESTTPLVLVAIKANQVQTGKDQPASESVHHLLGITKFQGSILFYKFYFIILLKKNEEAVCATGEISFRIFSLIK